ncbi:MAG TPA: bifunctional alpha/beta hydrolase/OsmC family protein [Cryomorphaceae bacterium]|nr:bifunctional alpha/beta hydrolase/OsmC family protein [Cryomorphaceae bacterium]
MKSKNIQFKNKAGLTLSAKLELPITKPPQYFAIFAHCFTCGKNAKAATFVSRELTQYGFGVLRFDFTGLGMSEGDFGDTGFTSNISDLEAAADFLNQNYSAPQLLIGHSLGGTAVLHAAAKLASVEAVCTIGAPAEAEHVLGHLADSREDIEKNEVSEVNIGGRPFNIGIQFIHDVESQKTSELLPKLRKALLIMHSPQDEIVNIDNAAEIYLGAHHPKSFITLDGANHLLTDKEDAAYAAKMIGAWVSRYLHIEQENKEPSEDVTVQLGSDGFTTEILAGDHVFLADEPEDVGGNNMGPTPYQLLNASLGTCTAMTLKMYADRKKWPLKKVTVTLRHSKMHVEDSANPERKKSKVEIFKRRLLIEGDLDKEQRKRLLEIANKCPVHRTLTESDMRVETELMEDLNDFL